MVLNNQEIQYGEGKPVKEPHERYRDWGQMRGKVLLPAGADGLRCRGHQGQVDPGPGIHALIIQLE